jgi:hypothetical protein
LGFGPLALQRSGYGTGKTFIAFQIAWKLFQSRWNLSREPMRRTGYQQRLFLGCASLARPGSALTAEFAPLEFAPLMRTLI